MPRLFGSKKDLKEGPVEATVPKKLFHLFRRGPQPETTNLPEQPSHRLASWKRIAPEPKKKKSYRISVYETSNESRTPSLQSTDGSDEENLGIRRGFMERIPSTNSHSSGRTRSQSLDRNWRDETTTRGRAPPSRCVPESVKLGPPVRIPPVHEGILKPLAFSPTKRSSFRNQEMVNAFDLDIARNATSLTDNMSAASSEDQPYLEPRPSQGAKRSPSTKRAVSFSKDVQDPKPKPPGSKAMCLGTGTSRRTVRHIYGSHLKYLLTVWNKIKYLTLAFDFLRFRPRAATSSRRVFSISRV